MPPVVVLDACVLYPAAQRDFFMWLAAGGAIRAQWTDKIHDEWMRNVERDYGADRNVLERVRKLMDRAAGDALISHYRQHERLFTKTDAKDRHVAAAAVAARRRSGVDIVTIVTWNLRDFDRKEMAAVGVTAETPDDFLCRLLADSPEDVIAAFVRMRGNLRSPPKTTQECADTLAAQGLKKFAGLISARVD
ncbi:MAG: PIN domain-containing protein [Rhodocyclaceae bacterium]|nr:PIN domain-containing protein [Rhodocyclaceae bacterium]